MTNPEKPSIEVRLDRLEQWQARLRWTLRYIFVPLALYAAYAIIQWALPWLMEMHK